MSSSFHRPVWDRGEAFDEGMLRFTIGDDWQMDQRLVEYDLRGSVAHVDGLLRAGLIESVDHGAIRAGLAELLEEYRSGDWDVEPGDEDVHSAVERRLIERVGDAGKRLHTGRSRNDQVAVDLRLWLRDAVNTAEGQTRVLSESCLALAERAGDLPLPGYTHLRRGMPSSIRDWADAHARAFDEDADDFPRARRRLRECPLGTGAGYGVPLELDRVGVAEALGFDGPEWPVTFTQHSRGRAELSYLTALEGVALDVLKLAADLWLFSSEEFGFVRLPTAFTTGSSLMPHKRNPDLIELTRAQARQVLNDRAALQDVIRDLPSGYHRDFQLIKPPLFRAHDRMAAVVPLLARFLDALELDAEALTLAANDPKLDITRRALERTQAGETFRDAYRSESEQS